MQFLSPFRRLLLTSSFLQPSTVMYKYQIQKKKRTYTNWKLYIHHHCGKQMFFVAQSPLVMDLKSRRKQGKEFKQPISPAIIIQRAQLLQLESSHQERDRVVEQNTSSTCHKFYHCLVCRTQEVNLIYQCPTFMRQERLLEFSMDCWNRQQWHLLNSLLNNAIQRYHGALHTKQEKTFQRAKHCRASQIIIPCQYLL